ncbi:MAG: HutD family protein [Acetobacteraceae bacterium]
MSILRAQAIPLTPWPNGMGLTRQLLAYPDLEHPVCHVSLAEITADCAFSHFPGTDRISVPVSGDGFTLDVEGFGSLVADATHTALRYPGDRPTTCRLSGGPVRVLNVMIARGMATAEQSLVPLTARLRLDPASGSLLAWCLDGLMTTGSGETLTDDEGVYTDVPLVLQGKATLVVVRNEHDRRRRLGIVVRAQATRAPRSGSWPSVRHRTKTACAVPRSSGR